MKYPERIMLKIKGIANFPLFGRSITNIQVKPGLRFIIAIMGVYSITFQKGWESPYFSSGQLEL